MEKKCYLCTERAHYMCPNMHFGILARIRARYDAEKVRETLRALQRAHPLLRSLIAEEQGSGRLYYDARETLDIPFFEKSNIALWRRDYDALAGQGWDTRRESLLRLLVYPGGDSFDALFMVHHLLCDGRGLLQLAREFAAHYASGTALAFVREELIASLEDLPPKSALPLVSRAVIDDLNRRWDRERHFVPYGEYLTFERKFLRENPVRREITTIEGGELEGLHAACRGRGVSVNDWLIARLMRERGTDKVVIAADIRDRLRCYREGAMGNYATAFSVVVKKRSGDVFELAERVSAQVAAIRRTPQKEMLVLACYLRMRPGLLDAAAVSSLGGFDSASGRFVGAKMFGYGARSGCCVTNLGKLESGEIAEAVFIPPASPANRVTWGVLTVNGKMSICAVTAKGESEA